MWFEWEDWNVFRSFLEGTLVLLMLAHRGSKNSVLALSLLIIHLIMSFLFEKEEFYSHLIIIYIFYLNLDVLLKEEYP